MSSDLMSLLPAVRHDNTSPLIAAFEAARVQLGNLVETAPGEHELQRYLEDHPVLLLHAMLDGFYPVASSRSALFRKVQLGAEFEADFLYCSGNSLGTYWTFVELEGSDVPLFTKKGDPTHHLTHAIRQVHDWQAWLTDHREYALDTLQSLIKSTGVQWNWPRYFRRPCQSVVIIGRRRSLTADSNRLRAQLCASHGSLQIVTWDRLFDPYWVDKTESLDASKDEVRPIREIASPGHDTSA